MSWFYLPPWKGFFSWRGRYVCSPPAIPSQTPLRSLPITKKKPIESHHYHSVSLHVLSPRTNLCRCALVTRAHPRNFPNAIVAPARISQPVISAVHGFVLKLTLDALYAVDVRWPGPTPCPALRRRTPGRRRIWARRRGLSETRRCCIDLRFKWAVWCRGGAAFTWTFVACRTWFGGGGVACYC